MLSLLSTLGGLLISGLPKLLEFFQNKADQKHELELVRAHPEIRMSFIAGPTDILAEDWTICGPNGEP